VGFDYDHAEPQHAHFPLVGMLVMTQMSVGMVTLASLARWVFGGVDADAAIAAGMLAGQAGLAVAPLHLGRPHLFFRAVVGWSHSWLSREAIVFGGYAAFSGGAATYAMLPLIEAYAPGFVTELLALALPGFARPGFELASIVFGVLGVFCSAKIYEFTGREFWLGLRTGLKFGGTPVVLGFAGLLAAASGTAAVMDHGMPIVLLAIATMLATAAKLAYEWSILRGPHDPTGSLRLTAMLHRGKLSKLSTARVAAAALGGLLLPLVAAATGGYLSAGAALIGLACLTVGELAERALYFSAVIPLRMPGGLKS
ncbi:MAG: hypothetical protein AAGG46_12320, partial [Planctomycetota bacterium]